MLPKFFLIKEEKKIKKPINILFKNSLDISKKFNLNLDLRPQNISPEIFYKLAKEYENLRS